jgi:hypothetical protein
LGVAPAAGLAGGFGSRDTSTAFHALDAVLFVVVTVFVVDHNVGDRFFDGLFLQFVTESLEFLFVLDPMLHIATVETDPGSGLDRSGQGTYIKTSGIDEKHVFNFGRFTTGALLSIFHVHSPWIQRVKLYRDEGFCCKRVLKEVAFRRLTFNTFCLGRRT